MASNNKVQLLSREEIAKILRKTYGAACADKATLSRWEFGQITTGEAIIQLITNNNAADRVEGIDETAFREFAFSLGYRRHTNG